MATNELYQYSIISALMDGVATHGVPLSSVLAHGNHGLGTFKSMDGEMIVLDGSIFQMKSDGSIIPIRAPSETITPFATVTHFQPTQRTTAVLSSKADVKELLTRLFPSAKNHFLAIRMDGVFKSINVRTAGGQCFPREGMVAVAERQTTHTFHGVRGTVVGFRCPDWVMGVNVAGDHMHFISEDRQRGGHILALETEGEVEVGVAMMSKFRVDLPEGDDEFNEAALVKDEKGIHAVEG